MKRIISFILVFFLFNTTIAFSTEPIVESYDSFEGDDIDATGYDWSNKLDVLLTLEFDVDTVWPNDSLMPEGFKEADREDIISYGMEVGLGIKHLHEIGIDGRGVNIAYIDQPVNLKHNELINANIHYEAINGAKDFEGQEHGNGMSSILVGQNIGVAPRANLYFMGQPSWEPDQKNEADAVDRIIEINKTLPKGEKIRVIGMSHDIDRNLKNWKELEAAKKRAEAEGILFVGVNKFSSTPLVIKPFLDKNDFNNYTLAKSYRYCNLKRLLVPTGGKVIANARNNHGYFYQTNSGVSSTVPFIVGVLSMGFQIAPDLSIQDAEKFLWESGIKYGKSIIINPRGFLDKVVNEYGSPYTVVLYNSKYLNKNDRDALNDLKGLLENKYNKLYFIDNKGETDFNSQYKLLQDFISNQKEKINGVQIIGTTDSVPAFTLEDKVLMGSGNHHRGGTIYTDYFYGNQNSIESLSDFNNLADTFKTEKDMIDFVQDWPVARLLITKGNLKEYVEKYEDYKISLSKQKISKLVNFSSPIFGSSNSLDDFGLFIKEKIIRKGVIPDNETVEIYANKLGDYPVSYDVKGDFNKLNLQKVNEDGIADITINSHGQSDNIDGTYYKNDEEYRYSLVNSKNINKVLYKNPYTLYMWNCWGASELKDGLATLIINKGKAVAVMANSYLGFNNGIDNSVNISNLVNNNSLLMYYMYNYYYRYCDFSHSESYYYAKRDYATSVLNHMDLNKDMGNYQFQLTNILGHHFIGLLDWNKPIRDYVKKIDTKKNTQIVITPFMNENIDDIMNENLDYKIPSIKKTQKDFVVFQDDGIQYGDIITHSSFYDKRFILNELSAAYDGNNIYIKVKYKSPITANAGVRLAGEGRGLNKFWRDGTKVGENCLIFKFDKDKIKSYSTEICIEVGDEHSITIEKSTFNLIVVFDKNED